MYSNGPMPEEINDEFRLIQQELFTVIAKWRTFTDLYGLESNVILLNETAPFFFRLVQDTFVDDIILRIVRLLDPPQSIGKENLTIAHLIAQIAKTEHVALYAELVVLFASIQTDGLHLGTIRNKLLAHNNLIVKQSSTVSLYNSVSRNFIEQFIQRLCALMNKIHASFNDTETYYEGAGINPDGSLALLKVLRKAHQNTREDLF